MICDDNSLMVLHACTDCLHPKLIKLDNEHSIAVGCGHCIPCRIKRTKEWSLRLEMESKDYNFSDIQFVTLTYENKKLPVTFEIDEESNIVGLTPTLLKRDVKLFMKRLRKRLDYPIRYFFVGEYGCRTGRPHYHGILFGLKREDIHLINECWRLGFTLTKPFFNETSYYVAGYIQKKLFSNVDYGTKQPPFLVCSQGLGLNFVLKPEVLANIKADKDYCIYVNGFKRALPRYFRRKLYDLGELLEPSYDDLMYSQLEQSFDLLQQLDSQSCSLEDYKKHKVAESIRKDIKNNRKRNSNTEV